MAIYTKTGDRGETSLPGGRRLPKSEAIFDVLGDFDQANVAVGLAVSLIDNKYSSFINQLQDIQASILGIGACLAKDNPESDPIIKKLPGLTQSLEKQMDIWTNQLPELKNFILPGGTPAAASLHLARTCVRRAERSFYRLKPAGKLSELSKYVNRLSDYFFQAARFANKLSSRTETTWLP
jgi:cob(I)alamin adenosyltransferase